MELGSHEKDERRVSLDELVGFCTVLDVTRANLLAGTLRQRVGRRDCEINKTL